MNKFTFIRSISVLVFFLAISFSGKAQVAVTISSSEIDQTLCEGETTTLTANVTNGTAPISYAWSTTEISGSITVAPVVTTTYTVTVTDAGGSATAEIEITVNPLPAITTSNDTTICKGQPITLWANGPTVIDYFWTQPNTLPLLQRVQPSITWTPLATITARVIVDDGICTNQKNILVTVVNLPVAEAGAASTICEGSCLNIGGAPTAQGTNPGPFTYNWTNAASLDDDEISNPQACPITTTTYTVTVTGFNSCSASDNVIITVNQAPIVDAGSNKEICSGSSTTLGGAPTASGGTPVYTYNWDNGAAASANPTVSPLISTTYALTVTDSKGCTKTDNIEVAVNPNPTVTLPGDQSFCNGGSYAIDANVAAGTPGYTYSWTPANGTLAPGTNVEDVTATPVVSTTYALTVNDTKGCTASDNIVITVNTLPTANAGLNKEICLGSSTNLGGAPTASGGSGAGYTYLWDNGAAAVANPAVSPALNTTYSLTITDGSGCTATDEIEIVVNPVPSADAGLDKEICSGLSTSIGGAPTASGGSGVGYIYTWDNGATAIANPTVSPIASITYSLTVTDSKGCTDADDVAVNVNLNPTVTLPADQAFCNGGSYAIDATVANGTPIYTYAWTPNDGTLAPGVNVEDVTASPIISTTYTLTVNDSKGCTASDDIAITVNSLPTANAGNDQTICSGVSVALGDTPTASGGSGLGFTYLWDNGAAATANPNVSPAVSTTYSLTVTDSKGCTDTDEIEVLVNPSPVVTLPIDQTFCNGGSYAIDANVASGTPGFTYSWTPADGTLAPGTNVEDVTATPIVSTTYVLTVNDSKGCTASEDITINVNSLPTANAGNDKTICEGVSTALGGAPTASGGSGAGYIYLWDNGAAASANPNVSPAISTTYSITLTDGNGCTDTDDIAITVNPTATVTLPGSQTFCLGGSYAIDANIAGGTPGFTYTWTPANGTLAPGTNVEDVTATPLVSTTYVLTINDSKGCTASDDIAINVNTLPTATAGADKTICQGITTNLGGAPTATGGSGAGYIYLWDNGAAAIANPAVTPLVSTTYAITLTDGNGCSDTDEIAITVNPTPTADAGTDQTICSGNTTNLGGTPTASGGSGLGFVYTWDNGASATANPAVSPVASTTYSLTISDSEGCTDTDEIEILVNPTPVVTLPLDQTFCLNGSYAIDANVAGGTPGYTYTWTPANGSLAPGTNVEDVTATPLISTTYTLTVNDTKGCTASEDIAININSLPTANAGNNTTICDGAFTNLGGTPTATGGTPIYTYTWDNGAAAIANPAVSPNADITYSLTVSDANGCTDTDEIEIVVNPTPTADAGLDKTICAGTSATLDGNVAGGTPIFTWDWAPAGDVNPFNGQTPLANPAVNTTYTLTVTDANGCSDTDVMELTVTPAPTATITAFNDPSTCGNNDGDATVTAAGGSGSYSYLWSSGGTAAFESGLTAGAYSVTVTDDVLGCTDIAIATLSDPAAFTVTLVSSDLNDEICDGACVTFTAGGATTYEFFLNGVSVQPDGALTTYQNCALADGDIVTAIGTTAGCSAFGPSITTTVRPVPLAVASIDATICKGNSTNINAVGGTVYAWSPALGLSATNIDNPVATPLVSSTYTVTVSNAFGCSDTDEIEITVNNLPVADAGANVSICIGTSTNLTANGGTSYEWNTTELTQTITVTPLINSTYTVTVTDGNTCSNTDIVTVTLYTLPTVDAGSNQSICSGLSTTLGGTPTATGGSGAGYIYTWDNGAAATANPTVTPLINTTYSITLTDGNGCTDLGNIEVFLYSLPTADAGSDKEICATLSTNIGGAPTASGGSGAGYTYNWNNGATATANPSVSPAINTTYTVTVTDGNGCTDIDDMALAVNPLPIVDAGSDQSICNLSSLNIDASVSSGTPLFSYTWTPNDGTIAPTNTEDVVVNPIVNTTYTLTVLDSKGCTDSDDIAIHVNSLPAINAGSPQTICEGLSATIGGAPTAQGGSGAGYIYLWDNGATAVANPTVSPIINTTYSLTVTDGNGCTGVDVVAIDVDPKPIITLPLTQNLCIGASYAIDASVASGTPGFNYTWSPSNGTLAPGTNVEDVTATPVVSTTYVLTVNDSKGCTDSDQIIININSLPTADAGGNKTICSGLSTTLGGTPTATGGSGAGYTYLWDNGAAAIANPTVSPIVNTTYSLTLTDGNGCTATDAVEVTVNSLPTADAGLDNTICSGSTTSIGGAPTAQGGSGAGYTYLWDNGVTAVANPSISPLVSTTYSLTITDGNGCTDTDEIEITANPLPIITLPIDQTFCLGGSFAIDAIVANGTPAYTYSWTPTNGTLAPGTNVEDVIATPIVSTTYVLSVTDQNGCTDSEDIAITVNTLPIADAGTDKPLCTGSSINLGGAPTASVGSGAGYIYNWDNGAAATANPTVSPIINTTYSLTVTDGNGCTATSDIAININSLPTAAAGNDITICSLSSTSLGDAPTASGGSGAGYTYLWNNGATAVSNPSVSPAVTTTYTVTVTDGNGCTDIDDKIVTTNPLPIVDAGSDQAICSLASLNINASVSAGTPLFTYTWTPNDGTIAPTNTEDVVVNPLSTTTYTLSVIDANGCTDSDDIEIAVNSLPIVSAGADREICSGLNTNLGGTPTAQGGSGAGYTYLWDNGVTATANPTVSPLVNTTYALTVTDGNGCTNIDDVAITTNPLPTVTLPLDQAFCLGGSYAIDATVAGGTLGYTYSWSPNNGSLAPGVNVEDVTATPLASTTYVLTVNDTKGCTDSEDIIITVHTLPVVDAGSDKGLCIGSSLNLGGAPTASAGSGAGYIYLWDNGVAATANPSVSPVVNTTYALTVTDGNGCSNTSDIAININSLPTADAGTDITICGGITTNLGGSPTATGGSGAGYIYLWDNGAAATANPSVSPLVSTTYSLTLTDGNGCTDVDQVAINTNPLPVVLLPTDQTFCLGGNYFIDATVNSGTPGYNFTWTPSDGSLTPGTNVEDVTATPLTTTTYILTASDLNGCTASDDIIINVNMLPVVDAGNNTTICNGSPTTLGGAPTASGGSGAGYIYLWDNGAAATANPMVSPISNITYSLTVTDGNTCSNTDQITVNVNLPATANAGSDMTICAGTAYTVIGATATNNSAVQWVALGGAGVLSNATTINPTYTPAIGDVAVTLELTSVGNAPCPDAIDQMVINFVSGPAANAGPDMTICANQSATLVGTASNYNTTLWTGGAGLYSNSASLTSDYAPNVTDPLNLTITFTVIGNGVCPISQDQMVLTINPLPNANAGVDQTVCPGTNANLLASGGTGYIWTGANLSATNIANPIATPTITNTYSVTVTDANGCSNTDNMIVNTYNVVSPIITPDGPLTYCVGVPINLTLDAGIYSTYQWTKNASDIIGQIAQTTLVTTVGDYSVKVQDANGCNSVSDTVTVKISNPIPVLLADGPVAFCENGDVLLYFNDAYYTYQWSSGSTTSTINVLESGDYSATITDLYGCQGFSDTISVAVNPIPDSYFGFADSLLKVDFYNFSKYTAGAGNFEWDFGDGTATLNAVAPSHTYATAGTYTVTLIATNACGTDTFSMDITVVSATAIEENNGISSWNVYPNPANNQVTVDVQTQTEQELTIIIRNTLGQAVLYTTKQVNASESTTRFDVANLKQGIYLVEIKTNKGILSKKLLINR